MTLSDSKEVFVRYLITHVQVQGQEGQRQRAITFMKNSSESTLHRGWILQDHSRRPLEN